MRLTTGDDAVVQLEPVKWDGSADVVGVSRAEALAVLPANEPCAPGQLLEYTPLA